MPARPSSFRKTDVKRLIQAAAMAGIKVGRVEITAGKITVIPDNDAPSVSEADERKRANEWDNIR